MEKLSKIFKGLFSPIEKEIVVKINEIIDYLNGNSGDGSYKVYTALLTQTGTDAPVAIILKNTLNVTPIWSRQNSGNYYFTLAGTFPSIKTGVLGSKKYINMEISSSDAIVVNTFDTDDITPMDDILSNTFIEIRVYN